MIAENKLSAGLKSTLAKTPEIHAMIDKSAEWSSAAGKEAAKTTETKLAADPDDGWEPTPEWVESWKKKLPLQTIIRVLQILVPQVEKICIDK